MTRSEANQLLDYVRHGGDIGFEEITLALWLVGDLIRDNAPKESC